jgi:tetratricopeptide (TPR) repeat protein
MNIALKWYQKAADVNHSDYHAPWNTSAVSFKMGDWRSTINYTSQALGLVSDERTRRMIPVRKAKAHLYLREIGPTQEAITDLPQGEAEDSLQKAIEALH